jgi:hypothetical protein
VSRDNGGNMVGNMVGNMGGRMGGNMRENARDPKSHDLNRRPA